MGESTGIAWTDHTFNPWMGCAKVSEGCRNCYAEEFVRTRFGKQLWGDAPRHVTKTPWKEVEKWNSKALAERAVRRVFCGSLCDVFEDHPTANETRPRLWEIIKKCKYLDWQLLTKRPENIERMLPDNWGDGWPNVWLGTTIEDMHVASRADALRAVPARIRFISYEPALGPLSKINLTGIHWVIYGGESGRNFRPEDKQWARDMYSKCTRNDVAFFHKQSASIRPGSGIKLDGELIQNFPKTIREVNQ